MVYNLLTILFVTFLSPSSSQIVHIRHWNTPLRQSSFNNPFDYIPGYEFNPNDQFSLNNQFQARIPLNHNYSPKYEFDQNNFFNQNNYRNSFLAKPGIIDPRNNRFPWDSSQQNNWNKFQTQNTLKENRRLMQRVPETTNYARSSNTQPPDNTNAVLDGLLELLSTQNKHSSNKVESNRLKVPSNFPVNVGMTAVPQQQQEQKNLGSQFVSTNLHSPVRSMESQQQSLTNQQLLNIGSQSLLPKILEPDQLQQQQQAQQQALQQQQAQQQHAQQQHQLQQQQQAQQQVLQQQQAQQQQAQQQYQIHQQKQQQQLNPEIQTVSIQQQVQQQQLELQEQAQQLQQQQQVQKQQAQLQHQLQQQKQQTQQQQQQQLNPEIQTVSIQQQMQQQHLQLQQLQQQQLQQQQAQQQHQLQQQQQAQQQQHQLQQQQQAQQQHQLQQQQLNPEIQIVSIQQQAQQQQQHLQQQQALQQHSQQQLAQQQQHQVQHYQQAQQQAQKQQQQFQQQQLQQHQHAQQQQHQVQQHQHAQQQQHQVQQHQHAQQQQHQVQQHQHAQQQQHQVQQHQQAQQQQHQLNPEIQSISIPQQNTFSPQHNTGATSQNNALTELLDMLGSKKLRDITQNNVQMYANTQLSGSSSNDARTLAVLLKNLLSMTPKSSDVSNSPHSASNFDKLQFASEFTPDLNRPSIDEEIMDISQNTLPYGALNKAILHGGPLYNPENDEFRVEYDMVLSRTEMEQRMRPDTRKKRALIRGKTGLWPNGVIPYSLSPDFTSKEIQNVASALRQWESYTCITFRKATPADPVSLKLEDSAGCSSYVGMRNKQEQVVGLSRKCRRPHIIMHEIGHAIGMYHEQSRYDRDKYLKIQYQNILPQTVYNFDVVSREKSDDYGVPYDYLSIMHYGETAFSADKQRITMKTTDPKYQKRIGKSRRLSFRDIMGVNYMYRCSASCKTLPKCPAEAFVGKDCECWCATPDTHREPAQHCKELYPHLIPLENPSIKSNSVPQAVPQTAPEKISPVKPAVSPTAALPIQSKQAPSGVSVSSTGPLTGRQDIISVVKLQPSNPKKLIGIPLHGNVGTNIADKMSRTNPSSSRNIARNNAHSKRSKDVAVSNVEERWLIKSNTAPSLGNFKPSELGGSAVQIETFRPTQRQVPTNDHKQRNALPSVLDSLFGSNRATTQTNRRSNIINLAELQPNIGSNFNNVDIPQPNLAPNLNILAIPQTNINSNLNNLPVSQPNIGSNLNNLPVPQPNIGYIVNNLPEMPKSNTAASVVQQEASKSGRRSNMSKLLDIQGLFSKRFGNREQTDPLVKLLYPLVTAALRMRIAQEQALTRQSTLTVR